MRHDFVLVLAEIPHSQTLPHNSYTGCCEITVKCTSFRTILIQEFDEEINTTLISVAKNEASGRLA